MYKWRLDKVRLDNRLAEKRVGELRACLHFCSDVTQLLQPVASMKFLWLVPQLLRTIEHVVSGTVDWGRYSEDGFQGPLLRKRSRPDNRHTYQLGLLDYASYMGGNRGLAKSGARLGVMGQSFDSVWETQAQTS